MNDETLKALGKIVPNDSPLGRDAVHIAVIPVVADDDLDPGKFVKLNNRGRAEPADSRREAIGIVDPFLAIGPGVGDRFWLFLFPGTITSLKHEWTHPAFPSSPPQHQQQNAQPERQASAEWIKNFAEEIQQPYDSLMSAANDWVEYGEYTFTHSEAYKDVPYSRWEEFWYHYEVVTGMRPREKDVFFTCSC
jgi:hypothetical protein